MGTSLIGDPFWKRFCVSVHSCSNLLDSEKLVYFQPSLKDGSVKNVVEGLPHFGLYWNRWICAQASETSVSDHWRLSQNEAPQVRKNTAFSKPVASSFTLITSLIRVPILSSSKRTNIHCVPALFKSPPHNKMVSVLKANGLCMNCLRPGHFIKQCKSLNCCRKCQKPHHDWLHACRNTGWFSHYTSLVWSQPMTSELHLSIRKAT